MPTRVLTSPFVATGELLQRIDLLLPNATAFASDVPAAVTVQSNGEDLRAGALTAIVTHLIRIRYLPGVESWMTAKLKGRDLQIRTIVNVDERDIELQLLCTEVES